VLGDDYQCDAFAFKTKSKTNIGGGSAEVNVDLFAKGDVQTPAKLTFKFPNTFLAGLSVDKFEVDKKGQGKLECSLGKALHQVDDLKVEVKSDFPCKDPASQNLAFAATYSGIADTSVKVETKQSNFADISAECLHGHSFGDVASVIGLRLENTKNLCPSTAISIKTGDIFASIVAKNTFSEFTLHKHYKVSSDMEVAATYQHGGKSNGNWAAAASAKVSDGTAKVKFESSQNLSATYKKELAKGTSLLCGGKFNIGSGDMAFGAKLNVE